MHTAPTGKLTPVPILRCANGNWAPYNVQQTSGEPSNFKAESIRAVTYNIWFDQYLMQERMQELSQILENSMPDLIAFQEVVRASLQMIKSFAWAQRDYVLVEPDLMRNSYGTAILCRVRDGLHVNRAHRAVFLGSRMGRDLLVVGVDIAGTSLDFGTSHLESLNSAPARKAQMAIASKIFQELKSDHCIYCGDFNFDAKRNYLPADFGLPLENDGMREVLPLYTDLWSSIHGVDDDGWTFNTDTNPCLAGHQKELMRYDRMLHYSRFTAKQGKKDKAQEDKLELTCKSIEMLGTTPVKVTTPNLRTGLPEEQLIVPSDHYGLSALFQLVPVIKS